VQEYDRTLKLLFQSAATTTLRELTGTQIVRWLNVEFQKVQSPRVDLLGEGADGELFHIELQSTNDPLMAVRMAEYCLIIFRQYKRLPEQLVVYVGREPMNMVAELRGKRVWFAYDLIDMHELDGDRLLASPEVSDNVIGILGRVADTPAALRRLVARIAELDSDQRKIFLRSLFIVAGLRGLSVDVEKEARNMPVLIDIMENEVLGREYKRGLEQGIEKGKLEGEVALLRRFLEKRFGPLPASAEQRLSEASLEQLEAWGDVAMDAADLAQLLAVAPPKANSGEPT